jgi:hypothetical protein
VLARALLHFSKAIPSNARLKQDKVRILTLLSKTTLVLIEQMTEGYKRDEENYLVLLKRRKLFIDNRQFPEAKADLQKGRCLYGFALQLTEEFNAALVMLQEEKQKYALSRCYRGY